MPAPTGNFDNTVRHKRRFCKVEGCNRIVKSQGKCQRHGAVARKCKIEGCDKQAQGNFDKMCKAHFKLTRKELIAPVKALPKEPPPPQGESVYDKVIPDSLIWDGTGLMPLVAHLKAGFDEKRPRGWHRNEERRARGLHEAQNPAIQLEGWERELVWMEICLLSGNKDASFRHLARAWARDKGFQNVLAQFICERQGNVERKKRTKGKSNDDSTTDENSSTTSSVTTTSRASKRAKRLTSNDRSEEAFQSFNMVLEDMDLDLFLDSANSLGRWDDDGNVVEKDAAMEKTDQCIIVPPVNSASQSVSRDQTLSEPHSTNAFVAAAGQQLLGPERHLAEGVCGFVSGPKHLPPTVNGQAVQLVGQQPPTKTTKVQQLLIGGATQGSQASVGTHPYPHENFHLAIPSNPSQPHEYSIAAPSIQPVSVAVVMQQPQAIVAPQSVVAAPGDQRPVVTNQIDSPQQVQLQAPPQVVQMQAQIQQEMRQVGQLLPHVSHQQVVEVGDFGSTADTLSSNVLVAQAVPPIPEAAPQPAVVQVTHGSQGWLPAHAGPAPGVAQTNVVLMSAAARALQASTLAQTNVVVMPVAAPNAVPQVLQIQSGSGAHAAESVQSQELNHEALASVPAPGLHAVSAPNGQLRKAINDGSAPAPSQVMQMQAQVQRDMIQSGAARGDYVATSQHHPNAPMPAPAVGASFPQHRSTQVQSSEPEGFDGQTATQATTVDFSQQPWQPQHILLAQTQPQINEPVIYEQQQVTARPHAVGDQLAHVTHAQLLIENHTESAPLMTENNTQSNHNQYLASNGGFHEDNADKHRRQAPQNPAPVNVQ